MALVLGGKEIKNARASKAITKKMDFKNPQTIKPNRDSTKQKKHNRDEALSVKRLVEMKLKKYKKLYADGKITRKTYLIKKKQLLEKL